MFRLIVKAENVRQLGATLESEGVAPLVERIMRHTFMRTEWIVDLVARPQDYHVRSLLTAWTQDNTKPGAFTEGAGFRMGTLLYWCEVPDTAITLQALARRAVEDMIATGEVRG